MAAELDKLFKRELPGGKRAKCARMLAAVAAILALGLSRP